MNNRSEATTAESAIRQLMLRCGRERNIGEQKIIHQILGLKIYCSSF